MSRILTMDELVQYFESNGITRFSEKESGESIAVTIPARFEQTQSDDFMLFAKIWAWHIGSNRNRSNATEKASKKAMKKMAYKPVLANFTDINGERDFTSHDISIDEDGNPVYIERQVGCFTADAPYMEHDDVNNKDYVCATVAIPREYTDAADIIERKGGTDVSVELSVSEMSYDAKAKELILNDFDVMGITLLGTDPDTGDKVEPGMAGARIEMDYSAPELFTKSEIRKLKKLLESYNLKEGGKSELNKFEELLAQYGKTAEDIDFDYSNMTDEELEAKFAELFSEDETPSEDDETAEVQTESVTEAEVPTEEAPQEAPDEQTFAEENNQIEISVTYKDDVKTFALSLQEKLNALYELVNATYGDLDGDWFFDVDADEEAKTVIFHGYLGSYRQQYSVRKGEYSLVGDRVPVHAIYVTDDEEKLLNEKLEKFEANEKALADTQEKLAHYEAEPEKMEVLANKCYEQIADDAEFIALKEQSTHFELSVDEVRAKADAILLECAKNGKVEMKTEKSALRMFGAPEKKTVTRGRYGGIFKKD